MVQQNEMYRNFASVNSSKLYVSKQESNMKELLVSKTKKSAMDIWFISIYWNI